MVCLRALIGTPFGSLLLPPHAGYAPWAPLPSLLGLILLHTGFITFMEHFGPDFSHPNWLDVQQSLTAQLFPLFPSVPSFVPPYLLHTTATHCLPLVRLVRIGQIGLLYCMFCHLCRIAASPSKNTLPLYSRILFPDPHPIKSKVHIASIVLKRDDEYRRKSVFGSIGHALRSRHIYDGSARANAPDDITSVAHAVGLMAHAVG